MGLLSSNLLAALRASQSRPAYLLEMTMPTGTTVRYARGVWDSSGAPYEDRVMKWGKLKRAISDARSGSIPAITTQIDLRDDDGVWSRLVKGYARDRVAGSAAVIRIGEASLSSSDYFTLFSGILTGPGKPKGRVYTIQLRTNDLPMDRYHGVPLTQSDWPGADNKVLGMQAPRIYGRHATPGDTNGGMLPTLLVDVARFRHLVCIGWAKEVERVYVSGTEVSNSTYTIDHPIVNGRLYTVVTFTADQGTNAVTVDVKGYESVGDGSGTLIENPCDQIVHALHNWVWGASTGYGAWLSSAAPISTSAATTCAAYFTRKGFKGSGYIKDKVIGKDLVAGWLKTWDARAWWTNAGQLAFGISDHALSTVYPSTLYRESRHDIGGSFEVDIVDDQIISSVGVKYLFSANTNGYVQQLNVADPAVTREAPETLDMLWSYAARV